MLDEQKLQVANNIKNIRAVHNLSQSQLADKIKSKVTNNMDGDNGKQLISKLENGKASLTLPLARAYADCFDITLDEIYGRVKIPKTQNIGFSNDINEKKISISDDNKFNQSLKKFPKSIWEKERESTTKFIQSLDETSKSIWEKENASSTRFIQLLDKANKSICEKENASSTRFIQLLDEANKSIHGKV